VVNFAAEPSSDGLLTIVTGTGLPPPPPPHPLHTIQFDALLSMPLMVVDEVTAFGRIVDLAMSVPFCCRICTVRWCALPADMVIAASIEQLVTLLTTFSVCLTPSR